MLLAGPGETAPVNPYYQPSQVAEKHYYIAPQQDFFSMPQQGFLTSDDHSVIIPDAYGLGVHRNRFGAPVRLKPDFGGVLGEYLQIKTDAYGFGVHSDQYARPVREYPWP